jgi:flagellar hook-basal body complex protein FliE
MVSQIHAHSIKIASEKQKESGLKIESASKDGFLMYLKDAIETVNESQKEADKATMDVATGKTQNIHEAMLSMSHAELSFNYMVQIRNKALEAYQEIMRMPV